MTDTQTINIQNRNRNRIITCDGNIGSGKSTLVEILKKSEKFSDAVFVKEPVDEWMMVRDQEGKNILERFYENKKKYAYPFQELTLMSRYGAVKKAMRDNPGKVIFAERSVWTDKHVFAKMLHADGYIEDMEYAIYDANSKIIERELHVDGFIYIRTSPEKCMERIEKRSRKGEHTCLEYLVNCDKYHNEWLGITDTSTDEKTSRKNVLVIDGDIEFESDQDRTNEIISMIEDFLD